MSPAQPARRQFGDSRADTSGAPTGVLNIGQVLAELSADFSNITASKIRFLEEKGLISPQRTAAGYRKYTAQDVERLRFVLGLQRDQYLPLKVIRDYLDAIDRGEKPENLPEGVSISPRMVSDELLTQLNGQARQLTLEQLKKQTNAGSQLIQELVSHGLISAVDDRYDDYALKITKACVQLQEHGIEPRHLRPFRAAADREFSLVETAIAPVASRKDVASRARAADAAREISDICLSLHSALVNGQIARMDR